MNNYDFPKTAYYGKIISKKTLYSHSKITAKTKNLFIKQIEKIIWAYKLSPETTNLATSKNIAEIQVLKIQQKTQQISPTILRTIDKAILSPILFIQQYQDQQCYAIAYKHNNNISDYFTSNWSTPQSKPEQQKPNFPTAINLQSLYQSFIIDQIPHPPRQKETLEQLIKRTQQIKNLEKQINQLQKRIKTTKQFNKKVELNQNLRQINKKYHDLIA